MTGSVHRVNSHRLTSFSRRNIFPLPPGVQLRDYSAPILPTPGFWIDQSEVARSVRDPSLLEDSTATDLQCPLPNPSGVCIGTTLARDWLLRKDGTYEFTGICQTFLERSVREPFSGNPMFRFDRDGSGNVTRSEFGKALNELVNSHEGVLVSCCSLVAPFFGSLLALFYAISKYYLLIIDKRDITCY